jgi:spore germination cell wall hydrolase CwlJ-like protein
VKKVRTLNGQLDDFPINEVPQRMVDSTKRNALRAGKTALAVSIGTGFFAPASIAQEKKKVEYHTTERSAAQHALTLLTEDLMRGSPETAVQQPDVLQPHDIACLARNAYNEAGNQTEEGKLATVLVVLARTQDKRFPNTVCGAIYQKNQFSWTREPELMNKQNPKAIEKIMHRLDEMLAGQKIEEAISWLSFILGLPEETLYYKRKDWDHDNPQGKYYNKMSEPARKMWRSLRTVKTIGDHTFYVDQVPLSNTSR